MTVLSIIQSVCKRTGIPSPSTALGSSDTQVLQLISLLEEEGNDLSSRGTWQGLTFEGSHTSLATEDQGAIATIATNGFRNIKNETIWDRTTKLPVAGPVDSKDWQMIKATLTLGPRYQYRIRGGKLLITPTPTAGESWYFEYVSKNWILGADTTTYKQYFTLDTDTILLPEELLIAGLRWRWKKEKGQEYAEDMRTYEMQVKDAIGRDGSKRSVKMDGAPRQIRPGVFVPESNWTL